MRKLLSILALACALAAPGAASAEPSAKALALTRRVVAAMHVEETMTPILRSVMRQQVEMIVAGQAKLTDQQRTMMSGVLGETMDEVLAGGLMTDVMERLIPVYAEVYSEEELQGLADFYESPIGQRVLGKMPQLAPAAAKVMVEIAPRMEAQIKEKLGKKLEGLETLGK